MSGRIVAESNATTVMEFYNELWQIRDVRVDDWPLMSSIWPTVTLCLAYFYFALVLGPTLMKDREPMQLKKTIQVYNVFQIVLSAYMVYEASVAGWLNGYSWVCQDVDRSPEYNSAGMRMARICWLYFVSKFVEFMDTFFFLARKKFAHVSALQVIHHGLMPFFSWTLVRWLPGGQESFGGALNSVVHVVMYTYYFLASLGPQMQRYLWWKRYLTTFQMVQFVVVFSKSMLVILGVAECGYPWQFSCVAAGLTALFFVLFSHFYVKEYLQKSSKKLKAN